MNVILLSISTIYSTLIFQRFHNVCLLLKCKISIKISATSSYGRHCCLVPFLISSINILVDNMPLLSFNCIFQLLKCHIFLEFLNSLIKLDFHWIFSFFLFTLVKFSIGKPIENASISLLL